VGFVVEKVALGQVFSDYFGFHYHSSIHQRFTNTSIYHLGLVQQAKEWPSFQLDLLH
jgi:hypothetical protein